MTTTDDRVGYETGGGVARLQLSRPAKKNAIDEAMRDAITSAIDSFAEDDAQKVLVVRGTGDSFSAGTDVNDLEARLPEGAAEAVTMSEFQLPEALESLDKPTIAAINGLALGGGLELALACDVRIAAADAELGFPEITLGGFPGEGGTQRLPRETNVGTALLLILTGEAISADRAASLGLVQEVHPADELDDRVAAIADSIAEKDMANLVLAKRAITLAGRTEFAEGLKLERVLSNVLEVTDGRRERLNAFLSE